MESQPDTPNHWTSSISKQLQSPIADKQYDAAITVWIKKPHTVNRRLIGAKIVQEVETKTRKNSFEVIWEHISSLREERTLDELLEKLTTKLSACKSSTGEEKVISLIIRDLVPKQSQKFHTSRELIVKCDNEVAFFPLYHIDAGGKYQHEDLTLAYCIQKEENSLVIRLGPEPQEPPCYALGVSEEWLKLSLLPRLANWCQAESLNTEISSLKLIPVDEYTAKYQQLKAKYGPKLVESWQENTDPRKFVYEDIAIATYLLLLWEQDRLEKCVDRKQSFVDLGCGNGLLVHLLASEGHEGIGVDLRKRKIWEQYGEETVLKEMSITPSDQHLFPEYDWLIGNHSDELTPWIPVMAARSSYQCNYFVLPCCQWDFSSKFSQRKPGSSQYRTYLDYVQTVGEMCGFVVEEDTLRIPSTKRVCFIGRKKTYKKEEESEKDAERSAFITSRTQISQGNKRSRDEAGSTEENTAEHTDEHTEEHPSEKDSKWAENFEARKPEEAKSNNCLNIDQDVKEMIMTRVFQALLNDENRRMIRLENREKEEYNMGGTLALGDVIKLFDAETLKRLKSECGGMQTLLRNNHQLFHVEKGCVRLRDWTEPEQHLLHQHAKKKRKGLKPTSAQQKIRLCFLHTHHPQGCPVPSETCRFAHGEEELREKIQTTTT